MATRLPLTEVHSLCVRALTRSGVFSESSTAIANIIRDAERDGCKSHGLFRLPGYCEAVRMGKVDPLAEPVVTGGDGSSSIVHVDAARGFAPLAFQRGLPSLVDATRRSGVGLMVLSNQFHFSALWHEVEALADEGLAGLSFLNTKAFVAHHGGSQRIYGTNPMAFGFPRPAECGPPLLWDQAAATMARGEISLVQQAGERLPPGVGIDANGAPTDDPQAALDGAQLTFAGAKGTCIAMMVELLSVGMTGNNFSFDAAAECTDPSSSTPTRNGQLIIAIDPAKVGAASAGADFNYADHAEKLFQRIVAEPGAQLPSTGRHKGEERHVIRAQSEQEGIEIPTHLYDTINLLL